MTMWTAKEARKLLSGRGWNLIEHRVHADSFGNECLVMAKPLALRLVVDRGFSHVDLACQVVAEADWIPLEVAALAARRITPNDVEENCRKSCDFESDTGEVKAAPLFEDPMNEVLANGQAYANILANHDALAKAHATLATITASVLDDVPPDLLEPD